MYTDEGLIAEIDDQGNMLVAYGWQPDSMYGTAPLWQANLSSNNLQGAEFYYLHTDHLGTVQMATNGQGQVTWKANAEAFGKTLLNEENQITMNLRFPGQYYDQETGTHYNYFRDYSGALSCTRGGNCRENTWRKYVRALEALSRGSNRSSNHGLNRVRDDYAK